MDIDRVRSAVLEEATKEAEKVVAEARRRAHDELANAERDLNERQEMRLAHAHAALQEKAALTVQRERTEKAKQILARKNEVIARVFDLAREQLARLAPDEYRALLVKWLVAADPDQSGEVILSKRDRDALGADVVRQANEQLGRPAFTLSEHTVHALGGFVFRASSYELDHTFDAQLKTLRKGLVTEIASKLFPK